MEKAFITRFVSLTTESVGNFSNSSRSIAMIDAHEYDHSILLLSFVAYGIP